MYSNWFLTVQTPCTHEGVPNKLKAIMVCLTAKVHKWLKDSFLDYKFPILVLEYPWGRALESGTF